MSHNFETDLYLHGRCHLFALRVAEYFDKPISVLWDLNPVDDDYQPLGIGPCLVHAYVQLDDGSVLDAGGATVDPTPFEDTYPCNEPALELFDRHEFDLLIKKKGWDSFNPEEENKIDDEVMRLFDPFILRQALKTVAPDLLTDAIDWDKPKLLDVCVNIAKESLNAGDIAVFSHDCLYSKNMEKFTLNNIFWLSAMKDHISSLSNDTLVKFLSTIESKKHLRNIAGEFAHNAALAHDLDKLNLLRNHPQFDGCILGVTHLAMVFQSSDNPEVIHWTLDYLDSEIAKGRADVPLKQGNPGTEISFFNKALSFNVNYDTFESWFKEIQKYPAVLEILDADSLIKQASYALHSKNISLISTLPQFKGMLPCHNISQGVSDDPAKVSTVKEFIQVAESLPTTTESILKALKANLLAHFAKHLDFEVCEHMLKHHYLNEPDGVDDALIATGDDEQRVAFIKSVLLAMSLEKVAVHYEEIKQVEEPELAMDFGPHNTL